jgi:hypothetical protein
MQETSIAEITDLIKNYISSEEAVQDLRVEQRNIEEDFDKPDERRNQKSYGK